MGYFRDQNEYYHPERESIFSFQNKLRNSLVNFVDELQKEYTFKISKTKLNAILQDQDIITHNFVPKEYLLGGKSLSKENKSKPTYYIFQEYIDGKTLHDTQNQKLSEINKKQLVLFAFLVLLLHFKLKILPDTRPRHTILELTNWFSNTDNILVSKRGIKFIDTRWFWESDSNWVKRALILPEIILGQAKSFLIKTLNTIDI